MTHSSSLVLPIIFIWPLIDCTVSADGRKLYIITNGADFSGVGVIAVREEHQFFVVAVAHWNILSESTPSVGWSCAFTYSMVVWTTKA